MERDSYLYSIRRKGQIIVHKILPDEVLSRFYFKIVLNKNLNLKNPKTFNDKMQWLKLYYYPFNNTVIKCADKYAVREYIEEKGYSELLVPLIRHWENAQKIDWNELPDKFVMKCNHGCAYNILCNDKKNLIQGRLLIN